MTPFRDQAHTFHQWGLAVLPVARNKHPFEKGGVHTATLDGEQIDRWCEEFPDANIAVACGSVSGITVIDIDGERGERGAEFLEKYYGRFPETVEARSGNGRHLYFRYEPGVKNSAGKLAPGIDIRNNGGAVVAPPSVHASGRVYEWIRSPEIHEPAPFPLWALHKLDRDDKAKRLQESRHRTSRDVERLFREVATTPKGSRNHFLNRAAFIIGAATARQRGDPQRAIDRLVSAGVQSGLPLQEARRTAQSGFKAGYKS